MDITAFGELFEFALESAAQNVETRYNVQLPRTFEIEFQGMGYEPSTIDVNTALQRPYLK